MLSLSKHDARRLRLVCKEYSETALTQDGVAELGLLGVPFRLRQDGDAVRRDEPIEGAGAFLKIPGEEVTYFTWSGYDVADLHQDYVIKYGGPPGYTLFGEEEEALQKPGPSLTTSIVPVFPLSSQPGDRS